MAIIEDFQKLDIRLGKIIGVEDFPEARKPMFKLKIDFGEEIGVKWSAAGVADLHTKGVLLGKLVFGVVNLSPRQIGPFVSECLTFGASDSEGRCALAVPDNDTGAIGSKLF